MASIQYSTNVVFTTGIQAPFLLLQGPSGAKYYDVDTGITFTGPTGQRGTVGPRGFPGIGVMGATGYTGPTGVQGPSGPQGYPYNVGGQGPTGSGQAGPTGSGSFTRD